MAPRITGKYTQTTAGSETVKAFVPLHLPPARPQLDVDTTTLTKAEQALGRLAVAESMVPSVDWFIHAFVRKEAVLTSQIEGTQATLMDRLNFEVEASQSPNADVEEVCNYIEALTYARSELSKPKGLYLSLYLKRNQNEYYDRLSAVRTNGDWEGWTKFFLEAVAASADEAIKTIGALFMLVSRDRTTVLAYPTTSVAAVRLFEFLPKHLMVTTASVMRLLEITKPTAGRAIDTLVQIGILHETTGKKRDRTYVYREYVALLGEQEQP